MTIGPYLRTAAVSVLGAGTPDYSLAIWHGINPPLVMSLIALAGGVGSTSPSPARSRADPRDRRCSAR